jgi:hypothetical protein
VPSPAESASVHRYYRVSPLARRADYLGLSDVRRQRCHLELAVYGMGHAAIASRSLTCGRAPAPVNAQSKALGKHRALAGSAARPNKRMQLTKLRAAPVLRAEVPPCAPAGELDGGTVSQLIRSVRQT